MREKYIKQLQVLTIFLALSGCIQAKLTTLKHFDPSPNYSANDSMMPPNSQFLDLKQARIKNEMPSKRRFFGINFSGFVQKAVRARGYSGNSDYGSTVGLLPSAFELGDFRGTLYAMGLFLGANPNNGNTIWLNGEDTGCPADITAASIDAFDQVECLQNIALQLAGYPSCTTITSPITPSTTALVFIPSSTSTTPPPVIGTSIFHAPKLAQDIVYFGAFSLPIEYMQQGFRWEVNINCCDYVGLTIQSGFTRMKQYYVNTITTPSTSGQTALGPYSLSNLATTATTPAPISNLYNELNNPNSAPNTSPLAQAQATFNKAISSNIAAILNPDCLDSDPLCTFDDYSVDDVKIILSAQKVYEPFRFRHDDDDDTGSWPDMIFTPYAWVGGSVPVAKKINYDDILSLPFGNNGHASAGGAVGMTFDFAESVEVGFEGGVTYFFDHKERRPFPTHRLQRILYPFKADVVTHPGMNWHFRALLNAYQFLKHINFYLTYELIEHRKDSFTICAPVSSSGSSATPVSNFKDYFVPDVLTCRSDWRAQFFNAGLSFDIQPGMQASVVWQQPISPRNAYYPVTITGSINFLF